MNHAETITKVAVIGFGTMGTGIAQRFAERGYDVIATDVEKRQLDAGIAMIERNQRTLVEFGRLSDEQVNESRKHLATSLSLAEAASHADLVVEAGPEDTDLKLATFSELDKHCASETILATNTSGLSITRIATAVSKPERVAGYHWWNPPHIIPLVEVTKGNLTNDDTVRTLVTIAERLGKRPIVFNRDVPGFVGNRLQFAVFREAMHLLSDGLATA